MAEGSDDDRDIGADGLNIEEVARRWLAWGPHDEALALRRTLNKVRKRVSRMEPAYRAAFPTYERHYKRAIAELEAAAFALRRGEAPVSPASDTASVEASEEG